MRNRRAVPDWFLHLVVLLGACGDSASDDYLQDSGAALVNEANGGARGVDAGANLTALDLPYATSIESFEPGDNAGYGSERLPDVVLGPPTSAGEGGSLNVLSLGIGGEITVGFGTRTLEDGPGADLVVFENAFYIGGDRERVFAEAAEVSVSQDGMNWHAFPCEAPASGNEPGPGCAGGRPIEPFDPTTLIPIDPARSGGDAFDLADLEIEAARYVRIRDRAHSGSGNNAGFDLDAVGLVHFARRHETPRDAAEAEP